jgi:hypothetical protein
MFLKLTKLFQYFDFVSTAWIILQSFSVSVVYTLDVHRKVCKVSYRNLGWFAVNIMDRIHATYEWAQ